MRYVARYATSRAKLRAFLSRKVRERGWSEAREPDIDALANRLCELGYIDDSAYALAKANSLTSRGYGKRRLDQKLRFDGIEEADAAAALGHADAEALDSALRLARRRKLGPFAIGAADPRQREKAIATLVRAGHSFALARAIASLQPGAELNFDELRDRAGLDS